MADIIDLPPPHSRPIPPAPRLRASIGVKTPEEENFARVLEYNKVKYNFRSQTFLTEEGEHTADELIRKLVIRVAPNEAQFPEQPARLAALLDLWASEQSREILENIRQELSPPDPARGQAELAKWLNLLCREGQELTQVIFTQWIWLVRRKLFSLETVSQIMPILQGKSGGGKTKAAWQLFAPLGPLVKKWDLTDICDPACHMDLKRTYVGYVEELAGARQADMAALKGIITAETLDVRKFYTQNKIAIPQKCTFLGDTNGRVSEIIYDPTSGRRYWEVRCRNDIDLQALAEIDYQAIWACVDEQASAPIQKSPHFAKIKQLQHSKIRSTNITDVWIDAVELEPGPTPIAAAELYREYAAFATANDLPPYAKSKWARYMALMGFEEKRARPLKAKNPTRCLMVRRPG